MNPYRSKRAWLPAFVASVGMLVVYAVVQLVDHFAYDDRLAPANQNAPFWRWALESYNEFFGSDPLRTSDNGRILLATVATAAALVIVGYVLTFVAVRGLAPGSGVFAMFLGGWMALVVASAAACVVTFLVRYSDRLGASAAGRVLFDYVVSGITFGVRLGWLPSLVAALFWLGARPRPEVTAPTPAQRDEPAPPYVRDPATGGFHAGDQQVD